MGVLKPNTDKKPTGANTIWEMAELGVGVTVTTAGLLDRPPKVAIKLAMSRSSWSGAT